jgi:hypothetical protein
VILKIVVDWNGVYLFAWIGLLFALVIGYGGWLRCGNTERSLTVSRAATAT